MFDTAAEIPQKVFFLDFDVPVTNFLTALFTGSAFALNPLTIGILNNVCIASGAKMVCSTNRAMLDRKYDTVKLLTKAGFDCTSHLHKDWSCNYQSTVLPKPDKTASAAIRTHNIERWLEDHPEITHYVALDDLPLTLKNFVHITDTFNGVRFEELQKACFFLDVSLLDVAKAGNPKAHIKFPAYNPTEHIKP